MKVTVVKKESLLNKFMKGVKNLFKRDLIKNKIYAVIFLLIGYIVELLSNDATVFVFMLIFFAIPLFFAKENVID